MSEALKVQGWSVLVKKDSNGWYWRLRKWPAWQQWIGPFHCRGCTVHDANTNLKPLAKKVRKKG